MRAEIVGVNGGGQESSQIVEFCTKAAEPHVVINEVMANPAGKEPDQEWVELYNDGAAPVNIGGWLFEDVGGQAQLPDLAIAPGQYALLVNSSYDESGWGDRPPAQGTLLIRLEQLAKSGLSNAGEPLRLLRNAGEVASAVPLIPSNKQSTSIARIAPDALDDLKESFFEAPGGGTPGGPNVPEN